MDEFSKLSDRPGAAVDLVERARSFNVAVVLIAQAWASLGPDDTIRNRLAGTVGTVVVHQLKQPDDVASLAGTEWVLERTEQTQTLDHTGLGSQRAGNRYVVHPDDIRRLHQGEAFIIHGGQALKLRVRPPRTPSVAPPDGMPGSSTIDSGASAPITRITADTVRPVLLRGSCTPGRWCESEGPGNPRKVRWRSGAPS